MRGLRRVCAAATAKPTSSCSSARLSSSAASLRRHRNSTFNGGSHIAAAAEVGTRFPPDSPNRLYGTSSRREQASSAAAVASPSTDSQLPPAPARAKASSTLKSLSSISNELSNLKSSLFHLLGSSHPSLDAVAKYYFQAEGKHLRPMLVLLMAQATNGLGGASWESLNKIDADNGGDHVDESLTSVEGVLNDWNPEQMGVEGEGDMVFARPYRVGVDRSPRSLAQMTASSSSTRSQSPRYEQELDTNLPILATQRRLASITEMIHVASLLHDDVIDSSPLRRGLPSAPQQFSNKLSILAGDFLLGRASVALARLGSNEVVELLATVIANLVEGEVMQLRPTVKESIGKGPSEEAFEMYMRKTYLKTASLMAKSARAAVILGGCGELDWVKDAAYGYGRNLGIAFQLIDDMLDFLPPSPELGKPGLGADLSLGLTTAPSLFAWQSNPNLGPLISRKFSEPGDVEAAREMVMQSDGLERTRELARHFADEAKKGIEGFPEGPAKDALIGLTKKVVDRVA